MVDKIRVVIVDDSPTMRNYLSMLIHSTADMQVVGVAYDGQKAVELVKELRPDVVSMDINMPYVSGLEATRQIMIHCPTPVVIVSGILESNIELSLEALQVGALAVVNTPPHGKHPDFPRLCQQFQMTLRAMAGVSVVARRERFQSPQIARDNISLSATWGKTSIHSASRSKKASVDIIAIGASTGGPSALYRLLSQLPQKPLPAILIVQHMSDEFIEGMAHWLGRATHLSVLIAEDKMPIQAGQVIIGRGNYHLAVQPVGNRIEVHLIKERGDYRYQPCVNILFESVALHYGAHAMGIVLTGMGDDGAKGLLALHRKGACTMVQDEKSSIVFGMPAAAIKAGGAQIVTPLTSIPSEIMKWV